MKKIIQYFLIFIFLGMVSACNIIMPNTTLEIILPEIPKHWENTFPGLLFILKYPEQGTRFKEVVIPIHGSVEIIISKEQNIPIILYPYIDDKNMFLKPAGGIYPNHLISETTNKMKLTWENGFAAAIFEKCFMEGLNVQTINSIRLIQEIRKKAENNPWSLDFQKIIEKLSLNTFRISYIKKLPTVTVSLYPEAGDWFLGNPFAEILHVEDNQGLNLCEIPIGFHTLFKVNSKIHFNIFIEEDDIIVFN
jgi:hypothetical protein